jgi:nucleotide-binding universal stress UspA family protein
MTTVPGSAKPRHGVLACTDFSPAADLALQRAGLLAARMGVPLTALHVVAGDAVDALRHWLGVGELVEQQLLDAAHERLRDQVRRCVPSLPVALLHPLHQRVSVGQVIAEIKAVVGEVAPELVVLGPRGESDLAHLVLGTTAERLLRRSQRPLLVVRNPIVQPYQRVLVPVDFSRWTGITLQAVRRIAPDAHLVLMHAWSVPFEDKLAFAGVDVDTVAHYRQRAQVEAEQLLHEVAHEHSLPAGGWAPCLVQGDASHAILAQASREACDLIALGKHGRHAAEELLLGSVCKHVLTETGIDVLVAT